MQCPSTCNVSGINDVLYLCMPGYETESKRIGEKNDERFYLYGPAMSPHRMLQLSWKQKNEILMECERRYVTADLNEVSDICEWSVNQLNFALPPSRVTVPRIICDSTIVRQKAISFFKKERKLGLVS